MKVVVIGASLGGISAITSILASLPRSFSLPILIVQHISRNEDVVSFIEYLNGHSNISVIEGEPLIQALPGHAYISPARYHMLIEKDYTISLSSDEKVNFSRPSIDVLFESAAYSFFGETIGILLTGANNDGSQGIKAISNTGGITIIESPESAFCPVMPASALALCTIDHVLPLSSIAEVLCSITGDPYE